MSERSFLLPDLGEGLTDAEIVRWLVATGDTVVVDQPLVEVETAKSLVEIPSPFAGEVVTLHGAEGETIEVGRPLVTVRESADVRPAAAAEVEVEVEVYREEERGGSGNVLIGYGTGEATGTGRRRRPRTPLRPSLAPPALAGRAPLAGGAPLVRSPLVRRHARELGVDLATVRPTGPGGVITRDDVDRATATTQAALPGEQRLPLNGFRKAVSAALSRSRSEIPEATVWVDVDATALWELRESARSATGAGPGLLAYLARFVVAALQTHPVLNSRLDTERQEIVTSQAVNLGLAVQTERGLVVPAVLRAETMSTARLDDEIRRLTASARAGRASAEELSSGTFTLNNYGSFRVDGSAAIINHPQVAILGFGRIMDRPWVVDGAVVVRKITQMSFSFDHRVCDGGTAAGFMRTVADAVEHPASAIAWL